eukprot:964069-Amphidinium_carterae.1
MQTWWFELMCVSCGTWICKDPSHTALLLSSFTWSDVSQLLRSYISTASPFLDVPLDVTALQLCSYATSLLCNGLAYNVRKALWIHAVLHWEREGWLWNLHALVLEQSRGNGWSLEDKGSKNHKEIEH